MPRIARSLLIALAAGAAAAVAAAQGTPPVRLAGNARPDAPGGLRVVVDADDDDEDGVVDAAQERAIPEEDLVAFEIDAGARLRVEGPLRVIHAGAPIALPSGPERRGRLLLQGTRASARAGDAALVVEAQGQATRIPVTVVSAGILDGRNRLLDARRDAVGVSHAVTNDASLPRSDAFDAPSRDPDNIRVELWDPAVTESTVRATIESLDAENGRVRASLRDVVLSRPRAGAPFRSPWLRLVADQVDLEAPGVQGRVLRVALRDVVRVRYETPGGGVMQSVRVGRPGDEDGPLAARAASMRVHILRVSPGGRPVMGTDDASAMRLGREQVRIANEVWLQCFVGWGAPEDAYVALHDPPPPTLVAIGEGDGLPAAGGGAIRFRVAGRAIRPVTTIAGDPPIATALAVARAVRALGFNARVTENAPTEFGAGRSADVLVRRRDGGPVTIEADGGAPLSTDARQTLEIGRVDLGDGVLEFDNMNAASGTLEERTLVKTLGDEDPTTIDIFLVNRFTNGTRQGEAFIEGDAGAVINALILDRTGIRQQRQAWTQSHEIGHVLLNQPFHPDNVGPDRPWLLMDSDSSLGTVTGPKRLSWDECHRVRTESGVDAMPALLRRYDARQRTPVVAAEAFDRGYPR